MLPKKPDSHSPSNFGPIAYFPAIYKVKNFKDSIGFESLKFLIVLLFGR